MTIAEKIERSRIMLSEIKRHEAKYKALAPITYQTLKPMWTEMIAEVEDDLKTLIKEDKNANSR